MQEYSNTTTAVVIGILPNRIVDNRWDSSRTRAACKNKIRSCIIANCNVNQFIIISNGQEQIKKKQKME